MPRPSSGRCPTQRRRSFTTPSSSCRFSGSTEAWRSSSSSRTRSFSRASTPGSSFSKPSRRKSRWSFSSGRCAFRRRNSSNAVPRRSSSSPPDIRPPPMWRRRRRPEGSRRPTSSRTTRAGSDPTRPSTSRELTISFPASPRIQPGSRARSRRATDTPRPPSRSARIPTCTTHGGTGRRLRPSASRPCCGTTNGAA